MVQRSGLAPSRRSQAGAVNVMWVIVMLVGFLAALGLWYTASVDNQRFAEAASTARRELADVEARFDAVLQAHQELSNVVGYRGDVSSVTSKSDPVAIQAEIDGIKADLGVVLGAPESKVTLAQAVEALRSSQRSAKQAEASARTDFDRELAARRAAEGAANAVESNYRGQLTTLNQQLSDERQRADNQSTTDTRRFDELVAAQQSADATAREAQQALAEFEVRARRETATAEATMKALAVRRQPPAPDQDDGHLLSVSPSAGIAYIDVGGVHGVRRGMRFEVLRAGKDGVVQRRGTIEVREVQDDMSLVALLGEPNPFDPMLAGDLIRNPHFEPGKSLRFFLLGDFPLTMSKEFTTARLRELGSEVDETVGTHTDVLVLGEKRLDDEEALELVDMEEYKLADKLGVRIVRLADLADFLRY
ncbi:MAG: hypothetical protein ACT4PU_05505 [Planctomycetota bacterium]